MSDTAAQAPLFRFDNRYARLPERFFARTPPTPVSAPRLIRLNEDLACELGLDPDALWVGVKAGFSYGETDEIGDSAVQGRVHMHDLHATILHLLGLDHERLTYRFQGRDFRLTDVHGKVVTDILA